MFFMLSHTGLLPSSVSAFQPLILLALQHFCRSVTPFQRTETRWSVSLSVICPLFSGTVWALPRSLATTYGITIVFFSCEYLDVSVPHVSPCYAMDSHNSTWVLNPGGFPHSDICGSMAICASPQLFAAYHVLLRLLVPRHPPCALSSLTFSSPLFLIYYLFEFYLAFSFCPCISTDLNDITSWLYSKDIPENRLPYGLSFLVSPLFSFKLPFWSLYFYLMSFFLTLYSFQCAIPVSVNK